MMERIGKLTLADFGKYKQKEFLFKETTIFYGKNEAGKTTLFDSILDSVAKPKGTVVLGKEFNGRYGEDRTSTAWTDSEKKIEENTLDHDEFQSIFAIRSGDLAFLRDSQGKAGKWIEQLKTRIFSGGVDPSQIIKSLGEFTDTKKSRKLSKEIVQLETEKEKAELVRNSLLEQKSKHANQMQEADSLHSGVKELEKNLQAVIDQLEIRKKKRDTEEKRVSRKKLESEFQALRALQELEEKIQKLSVFSKDLEPDFQRIEKSKRDLESQILEKNTQLKGWGESRSAVTEKIQNLNRQLEAAKSKAEYAEKKLSEIKAYRNSPATKKIRKPNLVGAVASFVGGAASLVLSFILQDQNPVVWSIFALLGVSAFVASFVFWNRKVEIRDQEEDKQKVARWKEDWNIQMKSSELDAAESLDGLEDVLYRVRSNQDAVQKDLSNQTEEKSRLEVQIEKAKEEIQTLEKELQSKRLELEAIWKSLEIPSTEEYRNKRRDYLSSLQSQKERWQQIGIASADQRKEKQREVERKLNALDEEGIVSAENDSGLQSLKKEIIPLEMEKEKLRLDLAKAKQTHTEKSTEAKISLQHILKELGKVEEALFATNRSLEEKLQKREAAGIAERIFSEIKEESNDVFDALSEKIETYLQDLLPEDRTVKIQELTHDKIRVEDASNTPRELHHLSQGTKDSFYLATRLALAHSYKDKAPLLVLDEPFLSLDTERTTRAIHLLRQFQTEGNWQIVFLTKDDALRKEIENVFGEVLVHEL